MIKILFVCHGNICRSPMAQCVFADMAEKAGLREKLVIRSAATHTDAIGDDIYPPAKSKLREKGIPIPRHSAELMSKKDYAAYDLLIAMDSANVRNMTRICDGDPEGKILRLLDLTDRPRDVADPWYTGDFETTFRDVTEGCRLLLEKLQRCQLP